MTDFFPSSFQLPSRTCAQKDPHDERLESNRGTTGTSGRGQARTARTRHLSYVDCGILGTARRNPLGTPAELIFTFLLVSFVYIFAFAATALFLLNKTYT